MLSDLILKCDEQMGGGRRKGNEDGEKQLVQILYARCKDVTSFVNP